MDLLSRIAAWLGENEATISAVVGIAVLAGIVFAGVRSLVRRRGETAQEKVPSAATEPASAAQASAPDLDPLTVPGFEGRPAIAVLPFDNLSGDPEQEYFADGIAEDLITRLSAWRWFPVIARNSSFVYKGTAVDVKQVSRELGARYVVEGSVRKAADRVRISAQLIDAATGHHLWAQRYDRELRDIFAVQDEITETIVGSIGPEMVRSESERAAHKPPQNLEAWDYFLRGVWHFNKFTKDDNAKARSLFRSATELDSSFGWPFAGLAAAHFNAVEYQWTDSPAEFFSDGVEAAQRAVAIDSESALSQVVLGVASYYTGEAEKAIAGFQRAIELDPGLAVAHSELGWVLAATGRSDEGLAEVEKAIRLSPRDQLMWAFFLVKGATYFAAGQYEEAVDWSERSLQGKPDYPLTSCILAASFAHLRRLDDGRNVCKGMLQLSPGFSLAAVRLLIPFAEPVFLEPLIDALRKAGLPE
jgi:TolB-like protein/Tfp pilus assembly protein PilF